MKRKILLGLLAICLSGILVACSNNGDEENPVNNALENSEVNSKANESSNKESEEGVNTESNKKENSDKNMDKKKENSTAKNGYLFSTEYEIEDYCHGYFTASKMDKRLHGILDVNGKEVVPLKYDDISIVTVSGYERSKETNFLAQYEEELFYLDEKAEKTDDVFVKETLLDGKNIYYTYDDFINENQIAYDDFIEDEYTNLVISEKNISEENDLYAFGSDVSVVSWDFLLGDYYLICRSYPSRPKNQFNPDGTLKEMLDTLYISDSQGNVVGEVKGAYPNLNYEIKKYDREVIVKFRYHGYYRFEEEERSLWNFTVFFSLNKKGEWKEVCSHGENIKDGVMTVRTEGAWNTADGYYEDADGNGIYKGICPENAKYVFGKNESMFLKNSYGTWKFVYGDDTPVYEDRYFDMVKIGEGAYEYFFLQNSDMEACLINKDGKKIAEDGTFTWEEGKEFPDFMGGNLAEDTVFAGDDALYIVRKNGAEYDVYRFGAK